ncbi:hypothetical protein MGYG_07835 [Nannizzia gypsea CBS 118893]|uniref:Serine hydrolase domain-containing protein n=1 Tax=Arthroderma gypseum (strain ATCC MYA-4604 / CBS 118893) TaxID=535722 RepID=E4V4A5_ARTGP|nr:hypothetical protein MGYG_07835 [Nannizzia gypsea CBS 118893]EFR04829.1 hypothetical protein MGYG_07835 [Nannizzia gypsea CBS 118893]
MKILCIHGSYGSASAFRTQLEPFLAQIEKPGEVDFKFIDGLYPAVPPDGFQDYFGPPPHFLNVQYDGIAGLENMQLNLRTLKPGESFEDTIKRLIKNDATVVSKEEYMKTLDYIEQCLVEDPEIQGILGYSEGATTAATYLLQQAHRHRDEGIPHRVKFGIFFGGWPPAKFEGDRLAPVLPEDDDMIDIPTCHIVGCSDPYLYGAMTLFQVCDEETATLFDHGKGHLLPRDPMTIAELSECINTTLKQAGFLN